MANLEYSLDEKDHTGELTGRVLFVVSTEKGKVADATVVKLDLESIRKHMDAVTEIFGQVQFIEYGKVVVNNTALKDYEFIHAGMHYLYKIHS